MEGCSHDGRGCRMGVGWMEDAVVSGACSWAGRLLASEGVGYCPGRAGWIGDLGAPSALVRVGGVFVRVGLVPLR